MRYRQYHRTVTPQTLGNVTTLFRPFWLLAAALTIRPEIAQARATVVTARASECSDLTHKEVTEPAMKPYCRPKLTNTWITIS